MILTSHMSAVRTCRACASRWWPSRPASMSASRAGRLPRRCSAAASASVLCRVMAASSANRLAGQGIPLMRAHAVISVSVLQGHSIVFVELCLLSCMPLPGFTIYRAGRWALPCFSPGERTHCRLTVAASR